MDAECRNLFVYGTLRRGSVHPMAAFLAQHARLVAEGKTPGRLLELGSYPGMVEAVSSDDWVPGDVFELHDPESTLAALDRYEGCDRSNPLYIRRQTQVTLSTGKEVTAWYYHYSGK
ncbi:MAG TPA: gamma-glutamylcyclotransferase family protein [Gemmataceae bacterium]|nr:gamma-glutamylcyclotransferase family protein [Gemmataceae bacterium]